MGKKLAKKQKGGPYQKLIGDSTMTRESKKVHPEKWDSTKKDIQKVSAPTGKDTARVGSVRITVAKKKSGGQTKSKKK